MSTRPIDQLDVVAEHMGLHLVVDRPAGLKRWRIGAVRPARAIAAGARPHRSYEGMTDLDDASVQVASTRLLRYLAKAPPSGGS